MIPNEFRDHFQFYGAIFGANSTEKLTRTTIVALGSLTNDCQACEVAGVTFTQVYASERWSSEHNYCIALMPPRPLGTGQAILVCLDLAHDELYAPNIFQNYAFERIPFEFHRVTTSYVGAASSHHEPATKPSPALPTG